MDTATHVSYDQVPYKSAPYCLSHPCHLGTIATLFGVTPPDPRACRVLELGCAGGGNLAPMAQDLPESQFLGFDLSARQIADGQAMLRDVGLSNIELRHQDIMNAGPELGKFDYIICHGVFSWVPRQVQAKIFEVGRSLLSPNGVMYISYNVYPGWHMRGLVRDMMRYHTLPFDEPQTKIDQARLLLDFLVNSAGSHTEAYRIALSDEAGIVRSHSDAYLFHEHLEEVNDPMYFHEFVERAMAAGLQYLGETEFASMLTEAFAPEVSAILKNAPLLRQEQYMDFLRNRVFRGSLLCQSELTLDRRVNPTRLETLELALSNQFEPFEPELSSSEPLICQGNNEKITATHPITKAALYQLNSVWPRSVLFESLLESATALVAKTAPEGAADAPGNRRRLAADLMALYARKLLTALLHPPNFTTEPGDHPRTTPLARVQAIAGDCVTNRRHDQIRLGGVSRTLVRSLDGQHSRDSLLDVLDRAIRSGELKAHVHDRPVARLERPTLVEVLDKTLGDLATNALLVG